MTTRIKIATGPTPKNTVDHASKQYQLLKKRQLQQFLGSRKQGALRGLNKCFCACCIIPSFIIFWFSSVLSTTARWLVGRLVPGMTTYYVSSETLNSHLLTHSPFLVKRDYVTFGYMLWWQIRPPVCLSSVTCVHPTQGVQLFGDIFAPYCSLAIRQLIHQKSRRSSKGITPQRQR